MRVESRACNQNSESDAKTEPLEPKSKQETPNVNEEHLKIFDPQIPETRI